ncbi:hypothetical protein NMG46_06380 [Mesorhizobium sp. LMG 17147]|uniref:hypothetical protein n=1 Tax=Mesorhizobium sp. LMG 17147 TaxID=2963091 RepID=UPI0020CA1233|nr:hypothetical protein [Mesorhizobium sp. LMG 17147]MCP9229875.1 hypothetical protein [Mesorhizobium sp. LMG 17147]
MLRRQRQGCINIAPALAGRRAPKAQGSRFGEDPRSVDIFTFLGTQAQRQMKAAISSMAGIGAREGY